MKTIKLPTQIIQIILFLTITLILTGCITFPFKKTETPQEKSKAECVQGCGTGGCSSEICGPKEKVKDLVTICIALPEYECLKKTICKCTDGKCQWEKTGEFKECMGKYNRNLEDFDFKE
jgi:eight-cysteine-cluster-containing protein